MSMTLLAFALPDVAGVTKILVFLIMLSILVTLHEYGHFLLARRNGVRVNDFAVGFGPTLLKWTSPRSGTNYRINALPLGGYCAMKGEDGKTNEAEQRRDFLASGTAVHDDDNFQSKSTYARFSIVVAGPIANFIVAFVLLVVSALAFGMPDKNASTNVGPMLDGYPAQLAGIHPGDTIVAIDGKHVSNGEELVGMIHASTGKLLHLRYTRGGITHEVEVTPRANSDHGQTYGVIGFNPVPTYHSVNPIDAVKFAGTDVVGMIGTTFGTLGALVTHFTSTAGQLQGVVGMARMSSTVQDFGWGPYLFLAAMLSVNLGVFNLLPIPALDGGRAIFIIAEMLRGKPIDPEKEALVHVGGFAVLILVMVLVTFHDISRIFAGKGVL